MNNLVIAVSSDSSLDLLRLFADVIVLDKDAIPAQMPHYETLYIRSAFSKEELTPQAFRTEIEDIVRLAKLENPNIKFIDSADAVEKILAVEDKWQQYEVFGNFMSKTQLLSDLSDAATFKRPVFKNRLASRGTGVTWNAKDVTQPFSNWVVQESLDIAEELRVCVIYGKVYPIGAIRQSKTLTQGTKALGRRALTQEEVDFALKISNQFKSLDFIGIDVVRTAKGELYLIEVNRSPGFSAFAKLTGINLASLLYEKSAIEKLEKLPGMLSHDKASILLVYSGLKPSVVAVLEGEIFRESGAIVHIEPGIIANLTKALDELGLKYEITTEVMYNSSGRPYNHGQEVVRLFASKNEQLTSELKSAFSNIGDNHHKAGMLLGYPKTAVDAFLTPNMLNSADLPKSTEDVSAANMRLLWHRLSKDNWREEVKYLELSGNYLSLASPKIYQEITSI